MSTTFVTQLVSLNNAHLLYVVQLYISHATKYYSHNTIATNRHLIKVSRNINYFFTENMI